MNDLQPDLFKLRRGGPRAGSRIPADYFESTTLEAIDDELARGDWCERDVPARRLNISVKSFDWYRREYGKFRDWRGTVRARRVLQDQRDLVTQEPLPLMPADLPPPEPELLILTIHHVPSGIIRTANAAACRVSGFTRDELEGAPLEATLRPSEASIYTRHPDLEERSEAVRRGGPAAEVRFATHWITKAGKRVDLACRGSFDPVNQCWVQRLQVVAAGTLRCVAEPLKLLGHFSVAAALLAGCLTHHAHLLHAFGRHVAGA